MYKGLIDNSGLMSENKVVGLCVRCEKDYVMWGRIARNVRSTKETQDRMLSESWRDFLYFGGRGKNYV